LLGLIKFLLAVKADAVCHGIGKPRKPFSEVIYILGCKMLICVVEAFIIFERIVAVNSTFPTCGKGIKFGEVPKGGTLRK
jgi:hypothetical protein